MSNAWKEYETSPGHCGLCCDGIIAIIGKVIGENGMPRDWGFCICPQGRRRKVLVTKKTEDDA